MKSCDQEKQLTAYLLGDLSGQEAAAVQQHLEQCPECRASLLLLQPTVTALQQALARDGAAPLALSGRRRDALLTVRPDVRRRVTLWLRAYAPVMSAVASLFVVLCAIKLIPSWPGMVSPYRVPCGTGEPVVNVAKCIKVKKARTPTIKEFQFAPSELESREITLAPLTPSCERQEADRPEMEPETPLIQMRTEINNVSVREEVVKTRNLEVQEVKSEGKDLAICETMDKADATDAIKENALTPIAVLSEAPADFFALKEPTPTPKSAGHGIKAPRPGHRPKVQLQMMGDPSVSTAGDLGPMDLNLFGTVPDRAERSTTTERIGIGSEAPANTPSVPSAAAVASPEGSGTEDRIASRETYVAEPQRIMNTLGTPRSGLMGRGGKGTDGLENGRAKQARESAQPPAPVEAKKIGGGCDTLESPRVTPATPPPPPPPPPPPAKAPPPPPPPAKAPAPPRTAAGFNPFVATATEKFSTFAIDVDTASYTLTRQALRAGRLPEAEVVRTEEFVNAFDYGDTAPDRATFRVYLEGAPSPFGPELTLLRIGVKGRRLGREEQRPAMLTFLIDTSGSMSQPDRIGMARTALKLLLANLAPADQVQLVAYDDRARIVLGATPAAQGAAILAAFDTLQCNGSTNLEDGMRTAYQQAARAFRPGGENRVILVSDGVANLGAGEAPEILARIDAYRRQGITCSVFGVGQGTYNDKMLEQLANQGDGIYRFLDSEEEVKRVFVDDLAATLQTIASDVKIQVEWNPEAVKRFRQLGYENRALKKEQFRDDTVDAGEVGSGESVSALYELDLKAGHPQREALGTVRVRYRRADNRAIEEIATPITAGMISKTLEATRPQFKLAAGVAEFAEILRVSPYAAGSRCEDVARLLRPVALAMPLDTRVKELVQLVEQADALTR